MHLELTEQETRVAIQAVQKAKAYYINNGISFGDPRYMAISAVGNKLVWRLNREGFPLDNTLDETLVKWKEVSPYDY